MARFSVAVATVALLAVLATANPDSIVPETTEAQITAVPREMDPFLMSTRLDDGNPAVLETIIGLKAFAEISYDKAVDLATTPTAVSALVDFILLFGEHVEDDFEEGIGGVSVIEPVSVEDYDAAVEKIRAKYSTGVGRYLIDHLDQAVKTAAPHIVGRMEKLTRRGIFHVGLDYMQLGLDNQPDYFNDLAVSGSEWLRLEALIADKTAHKDSCCHQQTPYCLACNAGQPVGEYCTDNPHKCPGFDLAYEESLGGYATGSAATPASYLSEMIESIHKELSLAEATA